jgi:hypothetical protein
MVIYEFSRDVREAMMMLAEARTEKGLKRTKLAVRTMKQQDDACVGGSSATFMDGTQAGKLTGLKNCVEEHANHVPVIFCTPEGEYHEGLTPRLDGTVMFIESKHAVPIGMNINIRSKEPNGGSEEWDVAEGTVIWRCPSADLFENASGFGVRLKGNWKHSPRVQRVRSCERGRMKALQGITNVVTPRVGRIGRSWPGKMARRSERLNSV